MRLSNNGRYMEHMFPDTQGPHREEFFEAVDTAIAEIDKRLEDHLTQLKPDHVINGVYVGHLGIIYTYYVIGNPMWEVMFKRLQSFIKEDSNRVTFLESNMFAAIMDGNEQLVYMYASRATEMDPKDCEVLYGRAGCLLGLIFARRRFPKWRLDVYIEELSRQILAEGRSPERDYLMWSWHGKEYLGAIHGVAGVLMALCLCGEESLRKVDPEAMNSVRRTAEYVLSHYKTEARNIQSSTKNTNDSLVHFCHGATGWVPLVCMLDRLFPGKFTDCAELLGEVVWRRGLIVNKGPGICHGIGGSICALLQLFHHTRCEAWLHKAQWFAFYLSENWKRLVPLADRPYSLFEGISGAEFALSATHIMTVDSTRFGNVTSLMPGFMI